MKPLINTLVALTTIAHTASAKADEFDKQVAAQFDANDKPGPRHVAARTIPVPVEEVSPQMQEIIGAPYTPFIKERPKTADEWKVMIANVSKETSAMLPELKAALGVTVTPTTIAGVKAYIVEPREIPAKNKKRLLFHVHGGGYVFGAGEAAAGEAILMAGIGGYRVIAVDYRMPPDHPYPAALDDAMAVWKEAVKMADPKNMAIFGSSTGGGLTLAMVLRAKAEGLPLPAAIAPGTPWADLTDTGDSYRANEWVDNVLVTWDGWLGDAAKLYANGRDLKEPYLSPIYGDFKGFPPSILTTGTRDLFLSNTVRTHRKLRRAGVIAELNVYEGLSHEQYVGDPNIPEVKEAMLDIASFFDKHLGTN